MFAVKGPERIDYLRELCKSQGLLTDKPVDGGVREGTNRTTSGAIGQP